MTRFDQLIQPHLFVGHLPQPSDRRADRAADQPLAAVGRELDVHDAPRSLHTVQLDAGLQIPQPDRAVPSARGRQPTVGSKSQSCEADSASLPSGRNATRVTQSSLPPLHGPLMISRKLSPAVLNPHSESTVWRSRL